MLPESRTPIEYATKADLLQFRTELQGDIRELRQEIRADLAEFKLEVVTQLSEFRGAISDLKSTIITTLIAMTAIFGTLVAVLKLFA